MQTEPMRVLAVLVLYRRSPVQAAAWRFLCDAVQAGAGGLLHCLVYDNSPTAIENPSLPDGFSYHSNPANGGTAGAYRLALDMAALHGCTWLLLLDQDTLLPADYLEKAAAGHLANPVAVALTPRILHQGRAVSPAAISRFGSVNPVGANGPDVGIPTAISSGLVIRADALRAHLPTDPVFWLDYVDHMIFLGLSRANLLLGQIDVQVPHDLSVQDPAGLSKTRLISILAAETAFCRALGPAARAMLPIRRLRRAMTYLRCSPALVLITLRSVFK